MSSLLTIRRHRGHGNEHNEVATTLNFIGAIYFGQGRIEEALIRYHESLSIWRKTLGNLHVDVAKALNFIGSIYFQQGRLEQSLALCAPHPQRDLC